MIRRRAVMMSLPALAAPGIARAQANNVLRFVPRSAVAILDPV